VIHRSASLQLDGAAPGPEAARIQRQIALAALAVPLSSGNFAGLPMSKASPTTPSDPTPRATPRAEEP